MKNKLDKMFESDFVRVPRPFIRRFNLNTAVMLSEIYIGSLNIGSPNTVIIS